MFITAITQVITGSHLFHGCFTTLTRNCVLLNYSLNVFNQFQGHAQRRHTQNECSVSQQLKGLFVLFWNNEGNACDYCIGVRINICYILICYFIRVNEDDTAEQWKNNFCLIDPFEMIKGVIDQNLQKSAYLFIYFIDLSG